MFNFDEIYSVSNFLSLCNKTIEDIPICWLQGEISNLSRPASGHWYFSLKDKKTQVRCALFRLNQRTIKFTPENGMQVLLRAAPTLYEARGDFQLIIRHLEPVGVGNLNLAFEQLKNKLNDEGLFDASHKKNLPKIVNTIGVISSSTGAVIQDIIRVLNKRYPFAHILLFDSVVQGQGAADKISRAIIAADKSSRCDVLIVARGGGSLEDLWAFNEESLARVIFKTKTPIISAIGHETDTTIADFVADARAPTPSAAAMLATPDKLALLTQVEQFSTLLKQRINQQYQRQKTQLNQLKLRIISPNRQLDYLSQQLGYLHRRLNSQMSDNVQRQHSKMRTLKANLNQFSQQARIKYAQSLNELSAQRLRQQISIITNNHQRALKLLKLRLEKSAENLIGQQRRKLGAHISALGHLSPLATLSRGYSITTNSEQKVLSSSGEILLNQTIKTRLSDGIIYSKVEKIEKN
jgi:exodeoxyribonuclease VII large subunit